MEEYFMSVAIEYLLKGIVIGITFSYTCICAVGYYQEKKLKKKENHG